MLTELEQNKTDMEQVLNGYGMDTEHENGNENACGTVTECVLSSVPY